MDVVEALDETFRHAHGVIAGVRTGQFGNKTPCTEWTVRDLLEHMIGVVAGLGATAAGQPGAPFELGGDPASQFESAAAVSLAAWRRPGALDQVLEAGAGPMPGQVLASINLLDTAVHTWDLAAATGQPRDLPPAVAEAAMEASRAVVSDQLRPGRFGPEQPAPSGANTTDRLVAFLGRST